VPLFVALAPPANGRRTTHGFRHALDPAALVPGPRSPPLPKETPVRRAHRYQGMLDTGLVSSRAELARALGCSRAWVT